VESGRILGEHLGLEILLQHFWNIESSTILRIKRSNNRKIWKDELFEQKPQRRPFSLQPFLLSQEPPVIPIPDPLRHVLQSRMSPLPSGAKKRFLYKKLFENFYLIFIASPSTV
jgi:hypothetical protein